MRTPTKTGSAGARALASRPLRAALAALCLLSGAVAQAADVDFYAVLDKQEVGVDDALTLTVTISADAGRVSEESLRLPEAPDFETLSRSQSTQMSFDMRPGAPSTFRQVRVITMRLAPRRPGNFTITPGRLVVKGKAYETGALQVRVLPAGSAPSQPQAQRRPPPPQSPFGGMFDDDDQDAFGQLFGSDRPASDSDLYLRTMVDKKQAFLGEQVVLSTYLFARAGMDVSGVDNLKMPKLDGFWAEDLETPTQITGELKVIEGVSYRVFLLRKRALFPLKSGKQTIEPVEVDISTGLGFGFGFGMAGRKVHRAAQPLNIEVLPLPPNPPAGFDAANIGQWRLSAEATPSEVRLGEPVMLKVVLEGTGNLHSAALPKLPPIPGFKVYDPTVTEKATPRKNAFGGKRTLEYLLMPEQTGNFEVPALSFPYFDPVQKQYQVATSEPIPLKVVAGQGGAVASANGNGTVAPVGEHAVNVLGASGLRPLRYKGEIAPAAAPLFQRPFFWPVVAAPIALWLGLGAIGFARTTLRQTDPNARQRKAGSRARKRLKKAQQLLESKQPDAFYAEVSRALQDYLGDKLGAPVQGLTRHDLAARLSERGLPESVVRELSDVLDTCDAGRFAPGASETAAMEKLIERSVAAMLVVESARLSAEVSA